MASNLSAVRRPMPRPTIITFRHAHTDMNSASGGGKQTSLERGWSGAELDDLGEQQAVQSAKQVAGMGIKNLVCSDLPRNLQTAQIVGKIIGAEVHPTPMLRTWNTGQFVGGDTGDTKPLLKQYFQNPQMEVPGGESYATFYDRTRQAMSQAMQYAMDNPGEPLGMMLHSNHHVALDGILAAGVNSPVDPKLLNYGSDKDYKPGRVGMLSFDNGRWQAQKLYEPSQSLNA